MQKSNCAKAIAQKQERKKQVRQKQERKSKSANATLIVSNNSPRIQTAEKNCVKRKRSNSAKKKR